MPTLYRDGRVSDVLLILTVTIFGMLLLIANPGYFSHDELQKLDHIEKFGFLHYVSAYVVVVQGDGFGTPVRPISFLVQGVLALAMRDFPVIVHLVGVLTHGVVAVLVFFILLRFGLSRAVALASACIFSLNPMAVIATGWSAALMDRWYVLFGICALICVECYVRGRIGAVALGLIFIQVLAALLSKETAIMLPGLMLLFVLMDLSVLGKKRFWLAGFAMALPVLAYLFFRLPAIFASFNNGGSSSYSASFENVSLGLQVYLAYPFLITLTEAVNWVFVSPLLIGLSVAGHLLLIVFLWFAKGYRIAAGYIYCYLLFLVPVLFIPIKAAHYLYASSIFFSVAIAYLIFGATRGWLLGRIFGGVTLVIALVHTLVLQVFVYLLGACMDNAIGSLEAVHKSLGSPPAIELRAAPGAPEHILHRFSMGRVSVGENYPVLMDVVGWGNPRSQSSSNLALDTRCRIYSLQ